MQSNAKRKWHSELADDLAPEPPPGYELIHPCDAKFKDVAWRVGAAYATPWLQALFSVRKLIRAKPENWFVARRRRKARRRG